MREPFLYHKRLRVYPFSAKYYHFAFPSAPSKLVKLNSKAEAKFFMDGIWQDKEHGRFASVQLLSSELVGEILHMLKYKNVKTIQRVYNFKNFDDMYEYTNLHYGVTYVKDKGLYVRKTQGSGDNFMGYTKDVWDSHIINLVTQWPNT
jgi:hypothetical protein